MLPVLSREQMRAFDAYAIEECLVPSIVLMENAGRGAAVNVAERLATGGRVLIVCGRGNNGGDGFVVGRRLMLLGYVVTVVLTSAATQLRGDAGVNHDAYVRTGGTVLEVPEGESLAVLTDELGRADCLVDAIFGTGLDRPITGHVAEVIRLMNDSGVPTVSLDIPSGLHANSGAVLGCAVRADRTLTFAHYKLGLLTSAGAAHAGKIEVVDIGVPPALVKHVGLSARLVERADIVEALTPRKRDAHKGSSGRVLVVAGSLGKTGAALLTGRSALRSGAGLVTLCTFADAADALDRKVVEEMTARIDPGDVAGTLGPQLVNKDVVAVGPGLGIDSRAREVVEYVIGNFEGTVVLDADGITHYTDRAEDLAFARGRIVLTPHPGEMARLLGLTARAVEEDRYNAVQECVERTAQIVLLKGPHTIVESFGEPPTVNCTGNAALATGGSGDVLTGVIAAMACQMPPRMAAVVGAYVHGLAGETWLEGDRGMIASEIADALPGVIRRLLAAP